jgi:hypothetical protein
MVVRRQAAGWLAGFWLTRDLLTYGVKSAVNEARGPSRQHPRSTQRAQEELVFDHGKVGSCGLERMCVFWTRNKNEAEKL